VDRLIRHRHALFRMSGAPRALAPQGRRLSMVLWRQCMKPGPHVKARHGGAPRGRPDWRL